MNYKQRSLIIYNPPTHHYKQLDMNDSISKPLNESLKESIEPSSQILSRSVNRNSNDVTSQSVITVDNDENKNLILRFKIITYVGIGLFVIGLILFLAFPAIIHSAIVKGAAEKAVLAEDNQNIWAHFPGETGTIITRNYSFFTLENEEQFLLHGEKPRFIQNQGYIITQKEDYVDIKYNEDKTKVTFRDWLHFGSQEDSRDLNETKRVLNVPSLAYWSTLKITRPSVIFLQGFATIFTNIESSIKDTAIGRGINSQYLKDFQSIYETLLKPAGISKANAKFIHEDVSFGMNYTDNFQYWVRAMRTTFTDQYKGFSKDALELKDYFTLSDYELYYILNQFKGYAESLELILFENHYCQGIPKCTNLELAIRQVSSSYVTWNTPPVSSVTPTLTICTDNATCDGYFPELFSFYKEVYLKEYPKEDPFLTFDTDIARLWLDYNPSEQQGQYNKNQSVLFHIGNLDALFQNGTLHDLNKKSHIDTTVYLENIMNRFKLPSPQHTRVFWQWIKYIVHNFLKQNTTTNEFLGISDTFTRGFYNSYIYFKQNLQDFLVTAALKVKLSNQTCEGLVSKSFEIYDENLVSTICNNYTHDVKSQKFITDMILSCKWKYHQNWSHLKSLGITNVQLESHCDQTVENTFTNIYFGIRKQFNQFYQCDQTPNPFCSDHQLALKQWVDSRVTSRLPPSLENVLKPVFSFSQWDKNAPAFEYVNFVKKFPGESFHQFTIEEAYELFNFNNFFSALRNINRFVKSEEGWKNYVRYVVIFIGFNGFSHDKTAYEHIFGYEDQFLASKKNDYPPFGGDPSIQSYIAFNDPNITEEEAVLEVEMNTGKKDHKLTGQFLKINNLTYLNNNYTRFNGNQTYWVLESPWAEKDYFYGTNGKSMAPNQHEVLNVSIYVTNIQRYGETEMKSYTPITRHGYDADLSYLGDRLLQTAQQNPANAKYYQNYFAVFNQTSVIGAPIFMTKHHFMSCKDNQLQKVQIYNEDKTIHYKETSFWDDSYVIQEPYSGVAFQSTIFLQANYLFEEDNLFVLRKRPSSKKTSSSTEISEISEENENDDNGPLFLPIFAVYRSGNLTADTAHKLFGTLKSALNAKTALFYIGIVLSLVGAAGAGYGFTNYKRVTRRVERVKNSIKISMQPQKKTRVDEQVQKSEPLLKEEIQETDPNRSSAGDQQQRESQDN